MYHIIQDFLQRINMRLSPAILYYICMTLLLPIAFFLGRQSSLIGSTSDSSFVFLKNEKIDNNNKNLNDISNISSDGAIINNNNMSDASKNIQVGRVYASSKGKKYYIEGLCDGNVSSKNKVYYKDEAAAQGSGKTKAAGCR